MLELFVKLLMGHAVADFAVQSETMAKGKNRHRNIRGLDAPPGQEWVPTWPFWLTAHALIHGAAVTVATGSVGLGISETFMHWAIDFGKCEGYYGVYVDQGLHVFCKILWVVACL